MEVKTLIDQVMIKKGWNQTQLAKHLGVSQRSVSSYVQGVSVPGKKIQKNLEELAATLGLLRSQEQKITSVESVVPMNERELLLMIQGELKGVRTSYNELVTRIANVLINCEGLLRETHHTESSSERPATKTHQVTGGL